MRSVSGVLTQAAVLLEKGWAQPISKNAQGIYCDPMDPACAAWDIHGALVRAAERELDPTWLALTLLDAMAPGGSVQLWEEREGRTQADIVLLVRKAANRAWKSEREEAA